MKQLILLLLLFVSIEVQITAQTAQELYREGTNLLSQKQPEKAIIKFNRALELDSNLIYIYMGRALANMELKKWRESIKDFSSAFERENKNIDALDRLFGVDELYSIEKMLVGRGRCKFEIADYNAAISDYDLAIKINSRSVSPYFHKGYCLMQTARYKEALENFEKVKSVLPDNVLKDETNDEFADIWLHTGNCHRHLSDNNLAMFYFEKALKKTPNNPEVHFSLGNLKFNNKRWEEAILDYSKALMINPKHTNAAYFRALSYRELKKFKEADTDFDLLVKLEPDNQLYYVNRGFNFSDQEKYKEALKDYNKALELNPGDAATYIRRGHVLTEISEFDKAISDFTKAGLIDEKLKPYAFNNRGNVKRKLKNFEAALADVNESIRLDSLNAWAYLNKGLIFADQGLKEKAILEYNKAIKLNNQIPNFYFYRANTYMVLKQYDKAISDYNKAQELDATFKSKEIEKNKKAATKSILEN